MNRLPRWIKILATLWVAVLIRDHWRAAPLSVLWFCTVSLVLTTVGLWLESRLLLSMQAVGSIWWMLLWALDFLVHFVPGVTTTPIPLGQANYMFNPELSLLSRGLSLYHAWLPLVLLLALRRLGYDRRAPLAQTLVLWTVLLLSYALTPGVQGPPANLNLVYGLSNTEPQHWMSPRGWLVVTMLFCPIAWYLPTHVVFCRMFRSSVA